MGVLRVLKIIYLKVPQPTNNSEISFRNHNRL
jgi:hypothetical protein